MTEPSSEAPPGGSFSQDAGGWSFGGALTLDDAADVLQASRPLPLPDTGVVDFSGLMQADSSALAVIFALRRRAAAEGRAMTLTGLPASLRSLAVVYGVDDLLADPVS
ncbi:MAG: STAS domain-containing protein [Betaproteobacteria bacterium]